MALGLHIHQGRVGPVSGCPQGGETCSEEDHRRSAWRNHVPSTSLISPHMSCLVASSSDAIGASLGVSAELWDTCHLDCRSRMQLLPKLSSSWSIPCWQGAWFGWGSPHIVSEVTWGRPRTLAQGVWAQGAILSLPRMADAHLPGVERGLPAPSTLGEEVGNSQDVLTLSSPPAHLNGSVPDTRFT